MANIDRNDFLRRMADKALDVTEAQNDPALATEREASALFSRIGRYYKSDGKDKTIARLEQLIEKYPETAAAERAKATLSKIATAPSQ